MAQICCSVLVHSGSYAPVSGMQSPDSFGTSSDLFLHTVVGICSVSEVARYHYNIFLESIVSFFDMAFTI